MCVTIIILYSSEHVAYCNIIIPKVNQRYQLYGVIWLSCMFVSTQYNIQLLRRNFKAVVKTAARPRLTGESIRRPGISSGGPVEGGEGGRQGPACYQSHLDWGHVLVVEKWVHSMVTVYDCSN